MKIIYEATDGQKFNNKRDCLNHELKQKEYEIAKTQCNYVDYRKYKHSKFFADYLRIKKCTYKDYEYPADVTSNTQMRKVYWRMRTKAKTELKQSELKLKELKSIYHYAVKDYKTKRTDCLNVLLNLQKNETKEI